MNDRNRTVTTIALVNQKGGCGKTTTSVSLASCLAAEGGLKTVIVDLDPQCNATTSFGLDLDELKRAGKHTVADMFLAGRAGVDCTVQLTGRFGDRLSVIPGHRGMSSVHHRLEVEVQAAVAGQGQSDLEADDLRNQNRFKLKSQLETLAGEFDVIVIDTPPDLGFILTAALIASTHYIIPVKPSGYDLSGLDSLSKTLRRVKERLNPELRCLGVLPTMVDQRAKLDREIRGYLEEAFEEAHIMDLRGMVRDFSTSLGQVATTNLSGCSRPIVSTRSISCSASDMPSPAASTEAGT